MMTVRYWIGFLAAWLLFYWIGFLAGTMLFYPAPKVKEHVVTDDDLQGCWEGTWGTFAQVMKRKVRKIEAHYEQALGIPQSMADACGTLILLMPSKRFRYWPPWIPNAVLLSCKHRTERRGYLGKWPDHPARIAR